MRRLYLLRHAKSSWDDPGLADHDRPLAPRGRRAVALLAAHLTSAGIAPQLVLCSSARRARETLDGIVSALGGGAEVQVEDGLYHASDSDLVARLRAVPDSVQTVMLVGHNPAIQFLALTLGGGLPGIEQKYPTGALATLTFTHSWRDLGPDAAELAGFVKPKDLS